MKEKITLKINMAQSMDGHTIQQDGKWALGSKEDKKRMDKLRLWADCLIASRRSIVNDNPNLIIRSDAESKFHPRPVIIMNTLKQKIKSSSRVFQKPHPAGEFWVQSDRPTEIHDIIESQGFDEKRHGKWQVFNYNNINEIYQSLLKRGNKRILLEGGPTLNGLFLKENLIDEIYFTIIPNVWSGQSTDRIITGTTVPDLKFKLLNVERRKNEVFFRYRRSK